MSVAGYLGKDQPKLRLREGEIADGSVRGDVLEGKIAVEEARALDATKAWRAKRAANGDYASVEEYDAVLRAHCRLGAEGA